MRCVPLADRVKIAVQGASVNIRSLNHRLNSSPFSRRAHKRRILVERFFNEIKHCRAVATRFDKHDANFLASVKLAALSIGVLRPALDQ